MRISVVLPAPFSPTTAWTVPEATDNVTSSLATTLPKRRVTLRAPSRVAATGGSGLVELRIALVDDVPDLDLAVDDALLGVVDLREDGGGDVLLRVLHLREPDAVVLEAEVHRLAAVQLAGSVLLDEACDCEVG